MVIGFLSKLVRTITFTKVVIWTLAGFVGVLGYTVFENRSTIFGIGESHQTTNQVGNTFVVGEQTKEAIKNLVLQDQSVLGVAVIAADLRLNRRKSLYFFSERGADVVKDPIAQAQISQVNSLPLFTKDEQNNIQMIKLINGEFSCAPYSVALLSSAAPALNKNVISVCRASLPPYYGHFSGFLTMFLNSDPSVEAQLQLKATLETLATEIYFRDVIPTSRRTKVGG